MEGENRSQVYSEHGSESNVCWCIETQLTAQQDEGRGYTPYLSVHSPASTPNPPHNVSLDASLSVRRRNYWNDAENYHLSPSNRQTDIACLPSREFSWFADWLVGFVSRRLDLSVTHLTGWISICSACLLPRIFVFITWIYELYVECYRMNWRVYLFCNTEYMMYLHVCIIFVCQAARRK